MPWRKRNASRRLLLPEAFVPTSSVRGPSRSSAALKFLKQQKATFENFLLDEKPELFQKHFGFGAVPCVLVIGKDGKVVKKFTNDNEEFTYKDVRKVVDGLLK